MLREDADVALLRVFECFLESAPQQVLQVSYLLKSYYLKTALEPGIAFSYLGWTISSNFNSSKLQHVLPLSGYTGYDPLISAIFSFVGMATCLMTYQRSIRFVQEDKDNINWKGSVFIFFWHFFVASKKKCSISKHL